MGQMRILLAKIWHQKSIILLLLIAFPALFAMYGVNQQPSFTAVQTLSLNPENAQSNLLQDVNNPEFIRILNRQLNNETLLTSALNDVGILLKGAEHEQAQQLIQDLQKRLGLTAAGNNVIEITLTHPERAQILRLLEAIVLNFIDDIMAPERFAKDELTNSLANQVQTINQRREETLEQIKNAQQELAKADKSAALAVERKIAALEFQAQTLRMQKALAENEYQKALQTAQQNLFHPVIKPESSPVIISTYGNAERGMLYGGFGFIVALLLATLVVIISTAIDTSLRQDENIRKELGLRILGRMPHLGDVTFENGRISTMPRLNI